jgi:uncharacterized protein (TIGR03083 family)
MTDYEAAYRGVRERVTTLLRDRPDADVEQLAPGTPEWRVRDVVAHLGGVCDDIANGNMTGVATDPWTKAQVDKRRDWEFGRVLDDWTMHAGNVEPLLNDLGTPIGQMVFDAWTHEQDIRGALDEPGGRDSDAAAISLAWFCAVNVPMGSARAVGSERSNGNGSIEVIVEDGTFVLGGGERSGTLRTTRFELLRAITGRRSREQVRALDFDGPPLDELIFANEFFTPAARDIVE